MKRRVVLVVLIGFCVSVVLGGSKADSSLTPSEPRGAKMVLSGTGAETGQVSPSAKRVGPVAQINVSAPKTAAFTTAALVRKSCKWNYTVYAEGGASGE